MSFINPEIRAQIGKVITLIGWYCANTNVQRTHWTIQGQPYWPNQRIMQYKLYFINYQSP